MSHIARKLAATAGAIALLGAVGAATAQPVPEAPAATIYPVSFPTGSIALHQNDMETIHGVAAMMARDPSLIATVLGKADTVGTAAFNEHLSQRRAEAVFAALVQTYKVPASRVVMQWTGEREPVVATADNTPELQNRVVEIILQ